MDDQEEKFREGIVKWKDFTSLMMNIKKILNEHYEYNDEKSYKFVDNVLEYLCRNCQKGALQNSNFVYDGMTDVFDMLKYDKKIGLSLINTSDMSLISEWGAHKKLIKFSRIIIPVKYNVK